MGEFHHQGGIHKVILVHFTAELGGEEHQHGTETLATRGDDVGGRLRDEGGIGHGHLHERFLEAIVQDIQRCGLSH